ncbi:MAG TPA: tripartite tricarboxylate transporter substrate binding protein [Thermodesulfobacteriota bacterium]|nr:tripartite tricarboxylate transporter substrate binding protein [Thermodesulfobacteriota bacterium]
MKRLGKWIIVPLGVVTFFMGGAQIGLASSDYPNRPIEMVIPYSPGGGADIATTAYKDWAAKILGQPLISSFKPGAGGAVGSAFVAQAKPDGYTLLVGSNSPLVIAPLTKKGTGYSLEDFAPVCNLSAVPLVWCVREDSPYKTMKEFIAAAKTKKIRYATYGALTAAHIAMEALAKAANFQGIHVPYSGAATAMSAAMGGHVDIAIASGSAGMAGPGKLRILATASSKRLPGYQDVPTLSELGYKIDVLTYFGLWAPRGIPKENIQKVYEAHKKAAEGHGKEIAEILLKVEHNMLFLSPVELGAAYREDYEFHKKMLGEMGALAK